ncbi:MAG TPA: response regulator [Alphaproteobacteria bacterium]|nr:response regulator [Alphaproteobacteria bacterium]
MSDSAAHILVVDDDDRLRSLLQRYLSECGFRVSVARNAEEARTALSGLSFDLLVLDLMMPGESGLELTSDLRRTSPVPILLLTAMGEAGDRIAGLEHGADDYLAKPFEPRELVLRIEAILRRAGSQPASRGTVRLGPLEFDLERGELTGPHGPVHLTSAEADLLRLFASNPGKTIGRAELLEHSGANSLRAVDVQVTRLRRKIESDPKQPRFLQTVWGRGYVMWPDDEPEAS